jgi:hypothetical protein
MGKGRYAHLLIAASAGAWMTTFGYCAMVPAGAWMNTLGR